MMPHAHPWQPHHPAYSLPFHLNNRLFRGTEELSFPLDEAAITITRQPLAAARTYPTQALFTWRGQQLIAGLSRLPGLRELNPDYAGLETVGLPEPILLALYDAALEPVKKAAAARGWDWKVQSLAQEPITVPCGSPLIKLERQGEAWLELSCHGTEEALEALAQSFAEMPIHPRRLSHVTFEARFIRATWQLPADSAARLQRGDLLLLPDRWPEGRIQIHVQGRSLAEGEWDGREAKFVQWSTPVNEENPEKLTTLHAVVRRGRLSLETLLQSGVGTPLPLLDAPAEDPVTIIDANGWLADVRPLRIGDRFGLQIETDRHPIASPAP